MKSDGETVTWYNIYWGCENGMKKYGREIMQLCYINEYLMKTKQIKFIY